MKIWAIANQKGGVGKTTTTITLAGLLSAQGYPTLVVDLDPHGSLTTYLGADPDTVSQSVYDLFQGRTITKDDLIRQTRINNLFLLPSSSALTTLDRQLGIQHGQGLVLKQALWTLRGNFSYILVDCPPMLGVLMVNALASCDELIIPVQTEYLALKGLEHMLHTIQMIDHARRDPLSYLIVPTLLDRRTRASLQTLATLQAHFRQHLWESYIPVDTRFREASQAGMPMSHMAPWSRGTRAYTELLARLIRPVEKLSRAVG